MPREQLARILFGYEIPEEHEIVSVGYFELANGGTLYLSELSLLPIELQNLLLAAIENESFFRVGGRSPIYSDVRIIASTSNDIMSDVEGHRFRSELFYRLNSHNLFLPPLRDRKQDIAIMAEYFIKLYCNKIGVQVKRLSPDAKKLLRQLPWHGNIRELENTMETIVLLTPSVIIEREQILEYIRDPSTENIPLTYKRTSNKVTKTELQRTLQSCYYNKQLTAEKLGISRRTLYRYLEKFESEK